MKNSFSKHSHILLVCVGLVCVCLFFFIFPRIFISHYVVSSTTSAATTTGELITSLPAVPVFVPSYVETPVSVKGIYMSSWIAGTPTLRNNLVKIADDTEINSVVIDIKDYTGKVDFPITNPTLKAFGSEEVRVVDMQDFIESLHKKGIYVIARLAVFQDAYFVKHKPELAVKNKAGTAVWKDHKGISWIDPGSKEYWDYIVLIAKEARKVGFDEINFDYIRFPSDGNMKDISYPFSSTTPKAEVMQNFFQYLNTKLVVATSTTDNNRLKISADLFGMATSAEDDMGIGQVLEKALPYFDYIMPMVYPSHYPTTFLGFTSPEAHPYDVVHFALKSAVERSEKASTTPQKIRPWLQDFGLKMDYGPVEVKAQVKATYDDGLNSWILWSASNKYTKGALETE